MKKILLDTSGYSNLLKGDKKVQLQLEEAAEVFLSVIVIGELLAAFKNGKWEEKNRRILEKFISKPLISVINVTEETADIYAQIKHNLQKKGKPIPMNDVWIAAHALETGSKLVTYDMHFKEVEGLRL